MATIGPYVPERVTLHWGSVKQYPTGPQLSIMALEPGLVLDGQAITRLVLRAGSPFEQFRRPQQIGRDHLDARTAGLQGQLLQAQAAAYARREEAETRARQHVELLLGRQAHEVEAEARAQGVDFVDYADHLVRAATETARSAGEQFAAMRDWFRNLGKPDAVFVSVDKAMAGKTAWLDGQLVDYKTTDPALFRGRRVTFDSVTSLYAAPVPVNPALPRRGWSGVSLEVLKAVTR